MELDLVKVHKIFENGCNGGDGKFLLGMGRKPGMGGGGGLFYNGGNGKFLKSLYTVCRGVLTPLFYEDAPILPTPLFSNFVQHHPLPPLPCHPQPPPPMFFLLPCFFAISIVLFAILLNDNMDLHMSSLGTLVSEGPWCVFYATRRQVYRGLIHNVFLLVL